MSISSCTFTMQELHPTAHQLIINFVNEEQKNLDSVPFVLKKSSVDSSQKMLYDICSQNGKCSPKIISSLFQSRDVENSIAIFEEKRMFEEAGDTLFVLDISGKEQVYMDPTISACENVVLEFFKNSSIKPVGNKSAKKMHELFHSVKLDYIFNEGSLKSDILKTGKFTDNQVEYLQKQGGGTKEFCKIAEYILYGFKMGFETDDFKAVNYITPLSQEPFRPCKTSVAFYPPSYASLYHPETLFFQTLKKCYKVSGQFTSSQVSIVNVENLSK